MLKKELENSIVYNNIIEEKSSYDGSNDVLFSFDNSVIVSPIIYNEIHNALEMDKIHSEKDKFIHKLMMEELKNKTFLKKNLFLVIENNKLRYNIVLNELLMKEIYKKLHEYRLGYTVWKSLLGETY
jgi:hypothetical protein